MNEIHSFFDLFIPLFILLANICQIPSWESTYPMQKNSINEFVSIVLHCQIQMSKENRAPHLQRAQKYFSFFLCMLTLPQILESPLMLKSSYSSSAVSTLGECYTRVPPRDVLSGTLGTIDAKMGEGWSLGCS